jgi:hypothetical protein
MLPVKVSKSTVPNRVYHGHKVVGTTVVRLVPTSNDLTTGLLIRTPGVDDPVPNTAVVWVGGSNVTADSDEATGGFPLTPGGSLVINVEHVTDLHFISTAADQEIAWIAI